MDASPDGTEVPLYEALAPWLNGKFGVPIAAISTLDSDDDWTFVIKTHALIEAALNQLIVDALKHDSLHEIVSWMDTGDRRKGKLAFVKALDLLPSSARQFITIMSNLRNDSLHEIKNLNFTFTAWINGLSKEAKENFAASLAFSTKEVVGWHKEEMSRQQFAIRYPRDAITLSVLTILTRVEALHQNENGPSESIPKE